ncbi:MAG: translation elongation factor Ts [Patescibacteria group bacterium]|nr:MAG: translation elongation factor Ts [Patescibacteria group bacterium]
MEMIKKLRERTGAGIVDCKAALEEAGGDLEQAVEILRKKGIAKAAKRGDRETNQGLVMVFADNNKGYIFEMNAETDFVVRNDQFQSLAKEIKEAILVNSPTDKEALLGMTLGDSTVSERLELLSGVIGEKITLGNYQMISTEGTIGVYAHPQGNIGALVALNQAGQEALAQDIAMHVAAAAPRYILPEEVATEELDKEKEIYREQLLKEGKPEEMVEKILGGKVNKYYEEICLVKQEYIKEDKKKVEEILNGISIEAFVRFALS